MAALTRSQDEVGRVAVETMTVADVPEVVQVDRRCFSQSWPAAAYRMELRRPDRSHYLVMRIEPLESAIPGSGGEDRFDRVRSRLTLLPFGRIPAAAPPSRPMAGFAGMWTVYDEAHITTIGIDPAWQGLGLGELLLAALIDEAIRRGADRLTLEVRVSNEIARRLYQKYGFQVIGQREAYYTDNRENALLMTSPSLRSEVYGQELTLLRHELRRRLAAIAIVPPVAQLPWRPEAEPAESQS